MPQVLYVQQISTSNIFKIDPAGTSVKLTREGEQTHFDEELKTIIQLSENLKENPSALVKGGYVQVSEEDFEDRVKSYYAFLDRQTYINR